MCETMANIPVEEKSAYVLTEDMIDAAMNEQFAYQEDLESEGELSSLDDSVDDSQESCVTENVETNGTSENGSSIKNDNVNTEVNVRVNTKAALSVVKPPSNNSEVSVLVIETGLDKDGSSFIKSVKETPSSKEQQNANTPNGSCNDATDVISRSDDDLDKTVNLNKDDKPDLTILKSILSDDNNQDSIIDLCDSEVDDFSEEDDPNEAESIDDELRSVMETNLMAEIGMAMKKKTGTEPQPDKRNVEKVPENVVPRISVKNIAQISSHLYSRLPHSGGVNNVSYSDNRVINSKMNENQGIRNPSFAFRNPNTIPNIPVNQNSQAPRPIHINKIAVPHSTFVTNHGQRMKCVYVKSTSNLPFVINTPTQTTATNMNSNMKYVLTQPMKKGQLQMPAITALKNLTKNIQPQALLLQKNAKVLTIAQKLQMLKNAPQTSNLDVKRYNASFDALKNSLLLSSKKSYTPPDIFPENPTYTCIDCNDKFLLKLSLANHIERRSMSIRYKCHTCNSELQFYNRCALSIHLRGHNTSLKQIDSSLITINPIPKEMLEKGIVKSFFKGSEPNTNLPVKSTFSSVNDKVLHSNNTKINSPDPRWKAMSGASSNSSNLSNHKITTVAGQSKSVCYQTPSLTETSRPVSSVAESKPPNKKLPPLILPKPPNPVQTLALVNARSLPNQIKEQSTTSNKSPPKSVILFCNQLTQTPSIQPNVIVNNIPPNVVCEADSRINSLPSVIDNNDTEMVVDDDVSTVPNNTEDEEIDVENIDGNTTPSSTSTVLNSESEKSSLGKLTKSPTTPPSFNPKKRNCSECKVYCPNISKHLNGSGRPLRSDLACKICNLILPSKCALKIHHRIHMKIPPFKCPDCGKDFTSWDDLHAHLKFSCGHFAKCVRYICKGCKAHFPTQNGLAQHIVKSHGKDIFKCRLCPVAFYKKPSLIKHIFNDHPNETNKSKIGMDYKQCEMCPKKLLPEESYLVHAKEHTNSMIYGYKCSMCNIVYANKMAFIIHQIKEKSKKDLMEKTGDLSKTFRNVEPVEEPVQVSDSNSDFEDEPVIIRKYPELDDDSPTDEKDPLSLDDWECTQEQKVNEKTEQLCIVCKKNSVVLLPGIDLNRQSLCCKQCVKPLDGDNSMESKPNKWSRNAVNSFSKSINNRKSKPKSIYRSLSTDEARSVTKKRRISDISENEHSFDPLAVLPSRKKNRKKQKGKLDLKGQTHIQGQVMKSRTLDELCYKCSKCEFVTEKRESFLEHITVHRTDPNTYQCLECGLCFVVLPSLERHLQMHHGIKDVSSYTDNNKASLPQKPVQVEEETQDNQCRVCYEIFDCKSSLDKHFRIHGMAFMSRLSKSP